MPELPEVETIVRELKKEVLNRTFIDVWTDNEKMIKKPKDFKLFKKEVKGKRIKGIERRAKNILFYLSGEKILLVHQKMTGHFLIGKWKREKNKWISLTRGPITDDPMNRFLHLISCFEISEWVLTEELIEYLHSQGCVIKVEGELAEGPLGDDDYYGYACGLADGWVKGREDMLKAGYTLTEPIREE